MDSKQSDKSLEITKYFQDSNSSDIFDQISKLNFTNDGNEEKNSSTDDQSNPLVQNRDDNVTTPSREPVICRIFASSDDPSAESERPKEETFFDLLGSESKYSPAVSPVTDGGLKISKPSSYNTILSPEFPSDGSFFSPSSGTDVDSDAINDELFMKGATHIIGPSSIVSSGEVDRRRDAWIPSNRTRQALAVSASALPGTYTPERDLLTMPGVVLQEDMVDNVYEAVNHYLGEVEAVQRKVLTLNDVTQDERGLRVLIQAECYRAAVNLTSRLLTMYGQGIGRSGYSSKHTVHSIQLWFTRIALLVKLRSWSVAWAESEPWWDLDRPDLYFQFYSELYGGRPGTIVPFSFRLLLAELPQYVHKPQEAFKRLFSVLSTVRKILKNLEDGLSEDGSPIKLAADDVEESQKLWSSRETRVLHSIVNLALQQKDYKLAIDVLHSIIQKPNTEQNIYHRRALISALGRIFLQMGDMNAAREWFEKSSSLKSSIQGKKGSLDCHELVDQGLWAIADSDYNKGYEYFQQASLKDPTNIMVKNNMAVCLLYCGKQKEAVNLLESVVTNNPTLGLHESLLLNLCTLYELESSTAMENKYKMLKMVAKYKGDAISLNCLKLQIKE